MGFLDFLRKKKAEQPQVHAEKLPEKTEFSELTGWFSREFEADIKTKKDNMAELSKGIAQSFEGLKQAVLNMEKASFLKEEKEYTRVNMVKDSFVKKSLGLIGSFQVLSGGSYAGVKASLSITEGLAREMSKTSPKQLVMISNYFPREGADFAKALAGLESQLGDFRRFLDSEGKMLRLAEQISGQQEKLSELANRAAGLAEREMRTEDKKKETKNNMVQEKSNLLHFMDSVEWKELSRTELELRFLREEMAKLEGDANMQLSLLKRPLKKVQHMKHPAPELTDNPFRDTILQGRENLLLEAIDGTEKFSAAGRITLKESEVKKLAELKGFISGELQQLKAKYTALARERDQKQKALSKSHELLKSEKAMETRIESWLQSIKSMEAELDDIKIEKQRVHDEIQGTKKGAEEQILEVTGRRLEIEVAG